MSTNKTKRERLWKLDPHCRQCGILTVRPATLGFVEQPPDDMATLEHVFSRFHPLRHDPEYPQYAGRFKILCFRCNQANALAEQDFMCAPIIKTKRKKRKYMERQGFANGARVSPVPRGSVDDYTIKEALTRIGFGAPAT